MKNLHLSDNQDFRFNHCPICGVESECTNTLIKDTYIKIKCESSGYIHYLYNGEEYIYKK